MTANTEPRHAAASPFGRLFGGRWVPVVAATTAAVLTAGAIATAGGGSAGAATLPQAQSVGNFLDAALSGKPIDDVVKLLYATAKSPGTQSVQNPLDATALNAIHLPLTGDLQLPNLAGITLGAVNQVAAAHHDGSSYGASGAVSNSGGVSVGGNNNAFPANASVDLCASALSGGKCGSSSADALGELKLNIGAVAAVASTPVGYAKPGSTTYEIAGLGLGLTSPALGSLLGKVTSTLQGVVTTLGGVLGPIKTLLGGLFPAGCTLTPGTLPTTISLDGGAVTLNVSTATITVDLEKLLKTAGLDLNALPANTDLVKELVGDLGSVLANGLPGVVNGLISPLNTAIQSCLTALKPLASTLGTLLTTLESTITTVGTTLGGIVTPITKALAPLLSAIGSLVDIGVNVQPNGPAGTFTSALQATPKQGTPVIAGQTIVRAIEIDLLSAGINLLPVTAAARHAAAAKSALAVVALGNAAAGPSTAPATPSSTPPSSSAPPTSVPTGVPAGLGTHGGNPVLPITLLALGLMFAAGGAAAFKFRGRLNQH